MFSRVCMLTYSTYRGQKRVILGNLYPFSTEEKSLLHLTKAVMFIMSSKQQGPVTTQMDE